MQTSTANDKTQCSPKSIGKRQFWVLSEGAAGMENQALGLAKSLGIKPICIRIPPPPLHNLLPPQWGSSKRLAKIIEKSNFQKLPLDNHPAVVISCGHKAVAYSIALRRRAKGKTSTIHIQNPLVPTRLFDLVLAPAHDLLKAPNVIATNGALHQVTKDSLEKAYIEFKQGLNFYPKPLIVALIGGSTRRYKFDVTSAKNFGFELSKLCKKTGGSALVTASRRTSRASLSALKETLSKTPGTVWNGEGKNPYLGYLSHADYIFVTCDSVTMTSEAAETGKPIYIVRLKGKGSNRFERFFESFVNEGFVRWYDGNIENWDYTPPGETARIAAAAREFLGEQLFEI